MSLFQDQRPDFISVCGDNFAINGKTYPHLLCLIQKYQGVRKLFQHGKLVCYSMDGKIGHTRKTYCVFCNDNFHCQRKIRLSLILLNNGEHQPAVLDVNQPSFAALEELVETVGETNLAITPVQLKIIDNENERRVIHFSPE